MEEIHDLIKMENFLEYEKKVDVNDEVFKKLMFIYSVAIREVENKLNIIQDEFKMFYNYELIDHINTRIKEPQSIINKMKDKECELNYKQMIENINDIAGVRVVCPMKKDVFSVKNMIEKIPGIKVLKQKDYITNPKKSGYSSYHLIVNVPIYLSQQTLYVTVEIQIRTMAMDFWSSLEHNLRYKSNSKIPKNIAKELTNCAKIVNKLDEKMMMLKE